jgi:hypothetical protein
MAHRAQADIEKRTRREQNMGKARIACIAFYWQERNKRYIRNN